MNWGYLANTVATYPRLYTLDISSHCHSLITGGSGSGKSYALLYLLGSLLQDNSNITVYFCDFKNSEDFSFLTQYKYYYSGNDCYKGLQTYYQHFCDARNNCAYRNRQVIIFDEYPAFINYLSMLDKREKTKQANEALAMVAEILMLGRGISHGIWIVTQRADSTLFNNGARDNFMVVLGLGRLSKEQKNMLFSGEEIPDRPYQQGEGMLLADGYPLCEIKIPKICNIPNWKYHIKEILLSADFSP